MKNKYLKILIIVGILLGVSVVVGFSYALWFVRNVQTGTNIITTGCMKLELENITNAITLQKAYPLTDEEGANLTPYRFTVENTCNKESEYYQLTLEELSDTTFDDKYIKIIFNDDTKNLDKLEDTTPSIDGAIKSKRLEVGQLGPKESKSYSLNLYIDGKLANDEDSMNKVLSAKISITASKNEYPPITVIEEEPTPPIEEDDGLGIRYAYGIPTHYSERDYTKLNRNVFLAIDEDNKYYLCIIYNDELQCIEYKENDYDGMNEALYDIFGDIAYNNNSEVWVCEPNGSAEDEFAEECHLEPEKIGDIYEDGSTTCFIMMDGSLACYHGNYGWHDSDCSISTNNSGLELECSN